MAGHKWEPVGTYWDTGRMRESRQWQCKRCKLVVFKPWSPAKHEPELECCEYVIARAVHDS